ncbi:MAG: PVC-type heme-binding CxxCH protein [Bacteroidota bacterium]
MTFRLLGYPPFRLILVGLGLLAVLFISQEPTYPTADIPSGHLEDLDLLTDVLSEEKLRILPEDKLVFIGNTYIERSFLFGFFETYLHSLFPNHKLRIRNMSWPADEVDLRPRPDGFRDTHDFLQEEGADIIFASYGMNESYRGLSSVWQYGEDLTQWLEALLSHPYNGVSPPQIVLISPIAYEAKPHLPDGGLRNQILRYYSLMMKQVAMKLGIVFVDLHTPTMAYLESSPSPPLTDNGIHLSRYGDWVVSQILANSLFSTASQMTSAIGPPQLIHQLRRAIFDKNHAYSLYWRGPNMEYIYGSRNEAGGANRMSEEREQLKEVIRQLEEHIWDLPKPHPETIWLQLPKGNPLWASATTYEDVEVPHLSEATLEAPLHGDEKTGQIRSVAEALAGFHLPEGYEVNLFASEEDFPLANPMAMNFDNRGRLWVANTPTWPHPLPGKAPEDFLVILEDQNRDGKADSHTLFMDSLQMIHGFALGNGGVYISQTPNMIFVTDTNQDDVADTYEMILHGFGAEDAEHSINNLSWGPDGSLYFLNGIFFRTQVETPYGPKRLKDSGVFRYTARKQKFDVYLSEFFWNPWGLVFDRQGQGILLDASSGDLYHMSPMASNFHYPKPKDDWDSFDAASKDPDIDLIHEVFSFAPEGIGSAAGIGIIGSSHFPEEVQGRFLSNQIEGWRGTHWFDLKAIGTTYEPSIEETELFFSEDPHFRPVAMAFGPDGALYILDFYSPIFENVEFPKRSTGRDHSHGRVWRITHSSRPLLTQPSILGESNDHLLNLLKSPEATVRHFARRELQERTPEEVQDDLASWVANLDHGDPVHDQYSLEALWIYQGLGLVNKNLLTHLLTANEPAIRAAATRVLRYWQEDVPDAMALLEQRVKDEDMRVRLEAVIALGFSKHPDAKEIAGLAAKAPMDFGMQMALSQTMAYFDAGNRLPEQSKSSLHQQLPESKEPDPGVLQIDMGVIPFKMQFDKKEFSVPAGAKVELIFTNNGIQPHNLLICLPGKLEVVAKASEEMATQADAMKNHFTPKMEDILFATPLVPAQQLFRLRFTAPEKKGNYPYVCTFPGHWRMMNGLMRVE